jgi:hypothetical protein
VESTGAAGERSVLALSGVAAEASPAERLGEEAGAALWIGEPQPDRGRWLVLELSANDLASDAEERAGALVAAAAERASCASAAEASERDGARERQSREAGECAGARTAHSGDAHLALPRTWRPPGGADPATFALPAPGAWRVDALLPTASCPGPPELLGRLLLAELLDGLAAAHRRGWWHGLVTPQSLWLAGAPPERLIADCPRDPRVVIVGCGVLAMLTPRAQAAAIARAPREWVAPELRRGAEPGPTADVWSTGAVARALLPSPSPELGSLLDELQASRPEARPAAAAAMASARELALAGLAVWQRGAPPPPRLVPSPAPLLPAPGSRRGSAASPAGSASHSAAMPMRREVAVQSWRLRPPSTRTAAPTLAPLPFVGRPAGGAPAPALWLSMAPTAMAGILSVLLAMALLFAAQ